MGTKTNKYFKQNKQNLPIIYQKITTTDYNDKKNQNLIRKIKEISIDENTFQMSIYSLKKAISRIFIPTK